MSFGVSGFGAQQTRPTPQVFQALSLAGAAPQPPAPPYGNPNPNLVPVARPSTGLPTNLTLVAQPTFEAILNLAPVALQHPPIGASANSTAANGATNPAITEQVQGEEPAGATDVDEEVPRGPVSFTLTQAPAYARSGLDALEQTTAQTQAQLQSFQQAQQSQQQAQQQGPTQPQSPQQNLPATTASQTIAPAVAQGSGVTPPVANPSLVKAIVSTVQGLAVSAIYPGPIFSFTA